MGNVFYFANIVLFLITGVATSYGDIFQKKVVNKWLWWAVRNALVIFGLFFILSFLNVQGVLPMSLNLFQLALFRDILINVCGGAVIGCLFWYLGIWAAGDAKLFILYTLLIPLPFYSNAYIKYVPSFIFLLNTFIPVFLYVLCAFLLHISGGAISWFAGVRQDLPAKIAQWRTVGARQWRTYAYMVFNLLSFFWFLGVLQDVLRGLLQHVIPFQAFFFILFLFGRDLFRKLFTHKAVNMSFMIVFVLMLAFGVFYEPNRALALFLSSITLSISLIFFVSFINVLFNSYVEEREVQEVPVSELKDHMLLAARSEFVLRRDKAYFEEEVGRLYPDGLLPEQVRPVQEWFRKEGIKTVEVYKTFPFAPFIFLGGAITLLFKGSPFISLGISLFKKVDVSLGLHMISFLFPQGGL